MGLGRVELPASRLSARFERTEYSRFYSNQSTPREHLAQSVAQTDHFAAPDLDAFVGSLRRSLPSSVGWLVPLPSL